MFHGSDPKGWPLFVLMRRPGGVGFGTLWMEGSHMSCCLDSLETALGLIPSSIFAAAEARYEAIDGPESNARH